MTRLILAAGVAALAITAPAASQPGDRGGKDRGAQVQKDRGKARAQRTERRAQRVERRAPRMERRAERSQRVERRAQRSERANRVEQRAQRVDRARDQRAQRQRADRVREQRAQRVDRANRVEQRAQRVDRANRVEQRAQRVDRVRDQRQGFVADQRLNNVRDRQLERIADRSDRRLGWITDRNDRRFERAADRQARRDLRAFNRPEFRGLNNVRVIPVSQAQAFVGQPVRVVRERVKLQDLPNRLRLVYVDTPNYYYQYGDGYVYRINRSDNLISALLPLFGLGLGIGQPFPLAYNNYYLPTGLQPFYASSQCGPYGYPYGYPNRDNDYYRYVNGYVYEIDCRTGFVEDIDPLLGYGYGYGQMMPFTYSAYNVPYAYRPFYYDTSDYYYRYAPGAIYQVDPSTSLVTAVAALLTGGLTVGQPLPAGYNVYNVPYAYRTTYYDTPNAYYRYSNGYIYRVDPSTMLVTALVASALT
jgi:hypothetical protein